MYIVIDLELGGQYITDAISDEEIMYNLQGSSLIIDNEHAECPTVLINSIQENSKFVRIKTMEDEEKLLGFGSVTYQEKLICSQR